MPVDSLVNHGAIGAVELEAESIVDLGSVVHVEDGPS